MATAEQITPPRMVEPIRKEEQPWRFDIFGHRPWLKRLVRMPSFQFLLVLPNLAFFLNFFLITGLFGTPVGNRNIIIVFVWILWWVLLIAVLAPFGSRFWCTMCPLPFFGDWLQRRAVIGVRPGKSPGTENRFFGLNKRWPKKLSNIWLQNFGFLLLASFSALLVTRPMVSMVLFVIMIVLAAGMAMLYRLRTFCNYVCPISGFLSLYAMTSTVELRSADKDACLKCKSKSCIRGSDKGWACPWNVYMGIPRLGAVDVSAGHTVEMEFDADRPGVLTFLCWQVCSPEHSKLRGRFVVETSQESTEEEAL